MLFKILAFVVCLIGNACYSDKPKSKIYKIGSNIFIEDDIISKYIKASNKFDYQAVLSRMIYVRSVVLSLKLAHIIPEDINARLKLTGYEADEAVFAEYTQRLKQSISISDEEIESARSVYDQFKSKKLYLLREIVLDDVEKLKSLKSSIENSKNKLDAFIKLAKQNSLSKTAIHDGLVGWYNPIYNKQSEKEFQTLQADDMLMQKDNNLYVLYFVEAVLEPETPSDEELQSEILHQKMFSIISSIMEFYPVSVTETEA